MPELPEVETIRLCLEEKLINKTISKLEILSKKSFIGNPKLLINKKIISISRQGKQLAIHLSDNYLLLIHLKMTGQLIYFPLSSKGDKRGISKYTRLIFIFSDQSQLCFNDLRKFGWVRLVKTEDLLNLQKDLGIDLLDQKFTFDYFYSQIKSSSRPIKLVLLDQSKFAGIGNIYASEILFLAGINPLKPANKISCSKAQKLYDSILKVVKQAIKHGGSTTKDKSYIKPNNLPGKHQNFFNVYQREGEKCPLNCPGLVKRVKIAGRSAFFCPQCQK